MNRDDELFTEKLNGVAQRIEPASEFYLSLENELRVQHHQLHRKNRHQMMIYLRRLTTIAAAFGLLLTVILFVPPFRSLAQDIIDSLFTRAESNELTQWYTVHPEAQRTNIPDMLTIEEVEALVDFDLKHPKFISKGYEFDGALFSRGNQNVILMYSFEHSILIINQRPVEYADQAQPIGANAVITEVQIGIIKGQYVEGNWSIEKPKQRVDETTGIIYITGKEVWSADAPGKHLRWVEDNMIYEIEGNQITQQDLIDIALSMQ